MVEYPCSQLCEKFAVSRYGKKKGCVIGKTVRCESCKKYLPVASLCDTVYCPCCGMKTRHKPRGSYSRKRNEVKRIGSNYTINFLSVFEANKGMDLLRNCNPVKYANIIRDHVNGRLIFDIDEDSYELLRKNNIDFIVEEEW